MLSLVPARFRFIPFKIHYCSILEDLTPGLSGRATELIAKRPRAFRRPLEALVRR
jgi:hypothetical protein